MLNLVKSFYNTIYELITTTPTQEIEIKILNNNATAPLKAYSTDAGWDLYTPIDFTLKENQWRLIKLGIAITVPENTYGRIAPRSGLAHKYAINILGGVIDREYTKEVGVIIINHGEQYKEFKKGDRIAQLIITKIEPCNVKIVNELTINKKVNKLMRKGGFGSTGN